MGSIRRRLRRLRAASSVTLAVAVLTFCPATRAAQPLPQGDSGIASHHPNDQGIEADPDVVFTEDFENVTGSKLVAGSKWDNAFGTVSITQDPRQVHGGARAGQIVHTQPDNTHGAWRDFGASGFDRLYLRYYLKFDAAFPGAHHTGMALFAGAPGVTIGSSTGQVPNGSNHFTVLLDHIDPDQSWSPPGNRSPGFSYTYCYHMDQGSEWGDAFLPTGDISPNQRKFSGPDFVARPNVIPPLDKWVAFELMVQANTPGQADGRVAYWMDGVLTADFPNIRFRSTTALKLNFVVLSSYVSTNRPNQRLWYDDIVAAKSYIGPKTSTAGPGGADAGSRGDTVPVGSASGTSPAPSSGATKGERPPEQQPADGCNAGGHVDGGGDALLLVAGLALATMRRRSNQRQGSK